MGKGVSKVIAVFIAIIVLILVLVIPITRYMSWNTEVNRIVNKVNANRNSHDIGAYLNKLASRKYYDYELIEETKKILISNNEHYIMAVKTLKTGDGFWGVDIFGFKNRSFNYTNKLITVYSELIERTNTMIELVDILGTAKKNSIKGYKLNVNKLDEGIRVISDFGKSIRECTKGTFFEKEGLEVDKAANEYMTNYDGLQVAKREGDEEKTDYYLKELFLCAGGFTRSLKELDAKILESQNEYNSTMIKYNGIVDELKLFNFSR